MELDHDAATAMHRSAPLGTSGPGTEPQRRRAGQIMQLANRLLELQGEVPTVAELAHQGGYSQSHFSRLFHDVTGRPARQYLTELRLGRALNLLLHPSMPIGQITETLGYRNIFNFSRQFKQKTGQTPTRCRRRDALWPPPRVGRPDPPKRLRGRKKSGR